MKVHSDARAYFERVLGLKPSGKAQRSARCPFHTDKRKSFSFNSETGTWTCHAGCGSGGLADFRARLSVQPPRPNGHTPEPPKSRVAARRKVEATYEYLDDEGIGVFSKVRYPGKQFVLLQPNGTKNLEGVSARPLYNLPSVLAAKHVVMAEGEKDVDRLTQVFRKARMKDWAATTNFDGANGTWREEYASALAEKEIVLLPDNDDPGRNHAELFASKTALVASGVRYLALPDLPEKGDVSDYLDLHSDSQFLALLKKAPPWNDPTQQLFLTMAELVARTSVPVEWLVEGLLQSGNSALLQAPPKMGKSTFSHAMIRAVLGGNSFLDRKTLRTPVVYLTEMPSADLKPQLESAGLLSRKEEDFLVLLWHDAMHLGWPKQIEAAIVCCKRLKAQLLVVDTFSNWARIADENKASEMLAAFLSLDRAIAEGIGVWVESHERKSGGSIDQAGRGSNALAGKVGTIVGLRRPAGNYPDTYREIEVVGRHCCFKQIINLSDSDYVVMGSTSAVKTEHLTKKVCDLLPDKPEQALTLQQLEKATGAARSTLQGVLKILTANGVILKRQQNPERKLSKTNQFVYWKHPTAMHDLTEKFAKFSDKVAAKKPKF
jgi:hypothetical protein